ncbi:CpsB/CapC family capsule biosynthesis tyrosine phosphatase [Oscillospiraceae bacterium WX1]
MAAPRRAVKADGSAVTDIHCHVLYGVDDGAKTIEESLQMLRAAWQDGVHTVIATPHWSGSTERAMLVSRLQALRARLRENLPDLTLELGAECRLTEALLPALLSGACPTLAQSRCVLTEISPLMPQAQARALLEALLLNGFIPVVAHCERLLSRREDMGRLFALKAMGCRLQVNAETVLRTGRLGRWVLELLPAVDFIASDGHNLTTRQPLLGKAYDKTVARLGQKEADSLFVLNARALLGVG